MAAFLTVDLEDWFQSENVVHIVSRDMWDSQVLTVEKNVKQLLSYLDGHDVTATFFVLGWIAERVPDLVAEVSRQGHEIASHGYLHEKVYEIGPEAFREDVRKSKEILEEITHDHVRGYRAPTFSITDWAIDVLREEGFAYDSSFFPLDLKYRYGKLEKYACYDRPYYPIAPDFWEFSLSYVNIGTRTIPWSGGGYFRLIPYPLYRGGVRRILKRVQYFNFYIHPWEFERDLPKVDGLSPTLRFRHYNNIHKTHERFNRLIDEFDFQPLRALYQRANVA